MPDLDAVERAFAYRQAIGKQPALATPEGRAFYEVQLTLQAAVAGERPIRTVLGGVMARHYLDEPNEPKSEIRVCAAAGLDAENYLGVFTVRQLLEDLVTVGILEASGSKEGSLDELLGEGGTRKYRLREPSALEIERLDPVADAAKEAAAEARRAAYNELPPRRGIFASMLHEYRMNRWVKRYRRELAEAKEAEATSN